MRKRSCRGGRSHVLRRFQNGSFAPWAAASAAMLASAVPAAGQVFLNESQALQTVFGQDVVARREAKSLTDGERKKLEASTGLRFPEPSYNFLVVERRGQLVGYAVVLDEIGKSEPITTMVGITPDGKVSDVAVMVFRESRGWEVKEKRFVRQFHGKRVGDPIEVERDIINYSGATLSSKALTRAVKRSLQLFQEFYATAVPRSNSGSTRLVLPEALRPLEVRRTQLGDYALYRQARHRLGTICEIRLWAVSSADANAAFSAGFDEIERLDLVFSNYRNDSELSLVNNTAADKPVEVSLEFWRLSRYALEWWKCSFGTFDITVGPLLKAWGFWGGDPRVPSERELAQAKTHVGMDAVELLRARRSIRFKKPGMELDFGGLAKGYAAEAVARVVLRTGAKSALVNLGGSSMYALAGIRDPSTSPNRQTFRAPHFLPIGQWPVLVAGTNRAGNGARSLILSSGWSLSSSASSEKFVRTPSGQILSHVFDPRTGYPAEGPCSAFVLTRSGISGEAIAKPLLLLNDSDRRAFARRTKIRWASVQRPNDSVSYSWEPKRGAVFLAPVS
jgi:thiamine biosynthesis lipoprotein